MACRTVHVCISSTSGFVIIDREGSTRDTHCAVLEVPETIPSVAVIARMHRIVFFPWPKTVSWSAIADLSSGALFRGKIS
jgi:hypothetical protein